MVTHLKNCFFYTDKWNALADILPQERHIIGKSGTHAIERDNSNARRHPGRFTRRAKDDTPPTRPAWVQNLVNKQTELKDQ
jgi:IS1 family transposase